MTDTSSSRNPTQGSRVFLMVRFTLIIVLKPHTPLLVLDSHQLNYPLALPWVLPGDILKALASAEAIIVEVILIHSSIELLG